MNLKHRIRRWLGLDLSDIIERLCKAENRIAVLIPSVVAAESDIRALFRAVPSAGERHALAVSLRVLASRLEASQRVREARKEKHCSPH